MNDDPANAPTRAKAASSGRPSARRGRRFAALVLLIIAFVALGRDHWDLSWREWMLTLIGAGFVAWSAWARESALLVPGGILIGIGIGQLLAPGWGGGAFMFSMAGGFLLVMLLSRVIFGRQRCESWPLYPAAGLAFAGLIQVAGPDLRAWLRQLKPFWPYALVLVALYLWFSRPEEEKDADAASTPAPPEDPPPRARS